MRPVPTRPEVLKALDGLIAHSTQSELCTILAGLLAREAIIRALLDDSTPASSSPQRTEST